MQFLFWMSNVSDNFDVWLWRNTCCKPHPPYVAMSMLATNMKTRLPLSGGRNIWKPPNCKCSIPMLLGKESIAIIHFGLKLSHDSLWEYIYYYLSQIDLLLY